MNNASAFSYEAAFSRNLGLVSEAEQALLRATRVALPGLGGVGGAHLQTLARMGVGAFTLADPDVFEVVNVNRQLGALQSTVGQRKVEVMARMARDINPDAQIRSFAQGINADNIRAFLKDVNVVVDGIEFFQIETRELLYRTCREAGIPVVNAGPIGLGASVIVFTPNDISFEDYFGLKPGMTRAEKLMAFALGLGPGLKRDIDPKRVDLEGEKGPALASACMLCAATAATEVLKLVTGRGRLASAGHGVYFDPLRNRTCALRRRPSLTSSLRGRLTRWIVFREMHDLRRMHERELADRAARATESVLKAAASA